MLLEHTAQSFDGQLHQEKGLGDEIATAAQHGTGAALEVGEAGDENHGSGPIGCQEAQLVTQFKAVQRGHLDVQEDEAEVIFAEQF